MSKHRNADADRDRLPFVAPCRKLSLWAPFRWVRLGIADLLQAPQQSLVYGLAVALLIGTVSLVAWFRGSQWSMGGSYNMPEYVYDIAQLVHQKGMAPVTILSHSLGGMISLQYAGL